MKEIAKILMLVGAILLMAGFILWTGGKKFKWLGKLPGDIRIHRPGFTFYMPIVTMIIISIVLSLLLWIVQKFLK